MSTLKFNKSKKWHCIPFNLVQKWVWNLWFTEKKANNWK